MMDPFKAQYMNTTTPAQRKTIAQSQLFPALFTYWSSQRVDLNDEEMNKRSQVNSQILNIVTLLTYCNVPGSLEMVAKCLACEEKLRS